MTFIKNQAVDPNTPPAADTPQPAPKLAPEAILDQLRAMMAQVEDVEPLDPSQRKQVKQRARRQPAPVVEATISVIGASETVAQAVGQPADNVLQLQNDVARWAMVAAELRTFFQGVEGANLRRRERLAFITSQAYSFGAQLARDPANMLLRPQVEEVKRLKVAARRKKAPANPQSPAPTPAPAPAPATGSVVSQDTSTTSKDVK